MDIWTVREVHFTLDRGTTDKQFVEAVREFTYHYYSGWRHYLGVLVASHNDTIEVVGWPTWFPGWLARRHVANLAAGLHICGEATWIVARAVTHKA